MNEKLKIFIIFTLSLWGTAFLFSFMGDFVRGTLLERALFTLIFPVSVYITFGSLFGIIYCVVKVGDLLTKKKK